MSAQIFGSKSLESYNLTSNTKKKKLNRGMNKKVHFLGTNFNYNVKTIAEEMNVEGHDLQPIP